MKKEFVPYQQALELKELGFDEPCFGAFIGKELKIFSFSNDLKGYANDASLIIGAPTFSAVFRWFREKYYLFGCIDLHTSTPIHWYIRIDDIIKNDYVYHSEDNDLKFKTYEEAELACLIKLIEIVKEQKL